MYLWIGTGEEGTALGPNGTVQPVAIDWDSAEQSTALPGADKGSIAFS